MSASLFQVKVIELSAIATTLVAAALLSGQAAADPGLLGDASSGDAQGKGVLCASPAVATDLIGVVDKPSVYRAWLHGYLESGHCVVWNPRQSGLVQAMKSAGSRYPGQRPRLWVVYAPLDKSPGTVLEAGAIPPIR